MLPPIIKACVEYIERSGIESEGLYRVAGSVTTQAELRISIVKAYTYVSNTVSNFLLLY